MTERVEVLAELLGATLLAHPEGNGQPYWRRGELNEAVKAVRKDAGYFVTSHGGRPPKHPHPDIKWGQVCIIRRKKGDEVTGRFVKWNPRTDKTTVTDERNMLKSGQFFCKA